MLTIRSKFEKSEDYFPDNGLPTGVDVVGAADALPTAGVLCDVFLGVPFDFFFELVPRRDFFFLEVVPLRLFGDDFFLAAACERGFLVAEDGVAPFS